MEIFETLRQAADSEKAKLMSAYLRDQFTFLGIKTPERRKLYREFLKAQKEIDWEFVFLCWQQPEREFQYLALDYLEKLNKKLQVNDVTKLKKLITIKSWWDTVDYLDQLVGKIALQYPEVNKILLEWSVADNIWLRRVAIDHQLSRKEKTNPELLEQILINNFGSDEFFINKAIGWSLRDYSKTNPSWVSDFIKKYENKMARLSIKEASKYL